MVARRTAALWGLVLVLFTAVITWGVTTWVDGLPPLGRGAAALPLPPADTDSLLQGLGLIARHALKPPDMARVTQAALGAAVTSLGDPYSGYLAPAAYRAMRNAASGRYAGVGIEVAEQAGELVITRVLPDTPAADTPYVGAPAGAALGLAAGDRLLRINGRPVAHMDMASVGDAVQGAPGTLVQLEVQRGGVRLTFSLKRREITVASVTSRLLAPGLGYIRIRLFNYGTPGQFAAQLARLRGEGMRELVLDLRNNPGGLLSSVVGVARWVLPAGVVTYLQPRNGPRHAYRLTRTHPLTIPFVVLVNGHTASAAELLAAAIQDDRLAPLVGERTYGKGVVQQIFPLANGGALRLTVARYLSPDGRDINGVGVTPNETVPAQRTGDQLGNLATDPQLAAALRLLHRAAA